MFEKLKEYGIYIILGIISLGLLGVLYVNNSNTRKGVRFQEEITVKILEGIKLKDIHKGSTITQLFNTDKIKQRFGTKQVNNNETYLINQDGLLIHENNKLQRLLTPQEVRKIMGDGNNDGTNTDNNNTLTMFLIPKVSSSLIETSDLKGILKLNESTIEQIKKDGTFINILENLEEGDSNSKKNISKLTDYTRGYINGGYFGLGLFNSEQEANSFKKKYFNNSEVILMSGDNKYSVFFEINGGDDSETNYDLNELKCNDVTNEYLIKYKEKVVEVNKLLIKEKELIKEIEKIKKENENQFGEGDEKYNLGFTCLQNFESTGNRNSLNFDNKGPCFGISNYTSHYSSRSELITGSINFHNNNQFLKGPLKHVKKCKFRSYYVKCDFNDNEDKISNVYFILSENGVDFYPNYGFYNRNDPNSSSYKTIRKNVGTFPNGYSPRKFEFGESGQDKIVVMKKIFVKILGRINELDEYLISYVDGNEDINLRKRVGFVGIAFDDVKEHEGFKYDFFINNGGYYGVGGNSGKIKYLNGDIKTIETDGECLGLSEKSGYSSTVDPLINKCKGDGFAVWQYGGGSSDRRKLRRKVINSKHSIRHSI